MNAAVADAPAAASPAIAANDALARGNLQLADYLCREALRADAGDALAMSLLGHMASGLRRFQLADAWFTRAAALRPESADIAAWRDRAREMAQASRAHAAAGVATTAAFIAPLRSARRARRPAATGATSRCRSPRGCA